MATQQHPAECSTGKVDIGASTVGLGPDTASGVRLVEGDDGIAIVTIARPTTRNALSRAVLEQLLAVLDNVVGVRALVLTGGNATFCSGGDLAAVQRALEAGDRDAVTIMLHLLNDIVRRLRQLPIPTVAAVEGAAVGAGLALAMSTDLRVAGRRAMFIPGYLAVGASPDGGASYHLSRALGPHAALAAFILNRRIGSEELLAAGVVQEIVDDGTVTDAAKALAIRAAGLSAPALMATRAMVDAATIHDLDHHLDAEAQAFSALWDTEAFRHALSAFAGAGDA